MKKPFAFRPFTKMFLALFALSCSANALSEGIGKQTEEVDRLARLQERSAAASQALEDVMASERSIPQLLLNRATCIATFPSIVKAGFILGGEYGNGYVSCRAGLNWSEAVPLNFSAASLGLQFGARKNQVVMIFTDPRAPQKLAANKVSIGVDMSYSAGPVADRATSLDDIRPQSDIYIYAHSKGLMVDISMKGGVLRADRSDTFLLYGHGPDTSLSTEGVAAPFVAAYLSALTRFAPPQ